MGRMSDNTFKCIVNVQSLRMIMALWLCRKMNVLSSYRPMIKYLVMTSVIYFQRVWKKIQ